MHNARCNIKTCTKIPLVYNKRQCGIYCIQNQINEKFYIGSSKFAYSRWQYHKQQLINKKHSNPHLQAAWNQYGKKNFDSFLIEICCFDKLIEREQWYLDNTSCLDNQYGYNINTRADRVLHTPEQRAKMSAATKGVKHPNYGKRLSKETRNKISNAQRGIKNHNYGKSTPQSVKDKIKRCGPSHYKYDNILYKFFHPIYGLEESTQYNLKQKYKLTKHPCQLIK